MLTRVKSVTGTRISHASYATGDNSVVIFCRHSTNNAVYSALLSYHLLARLGKRLHDGPKGDLLGRLVNIKFMDFDK